MGWKYEEMIHKDKKYKHRWHNAKYKTQKWGDTKIGCKNVKVWRRLFSLRRQKAKATVTAAHSVTSPYRRL